MWSLPRRRRKTMKAWILGLAVLIAAVTLTSAAVAGPNQSKQQVTITAKGVDGFTLRPLEPGLLRPDSGTADWCCYGSRRLVRDGQSVEINDPLVTLEGKRGTLVLRSRIEWLDAGNGYSLGTSTWKVVRGTGVYAGISGSGRGAAVTSLPRVSYRLDGFLRR